jgi:hypothetical protein
MSSTPLWLRALFGLFLVVLGLGAAEAVIERQRGLPEAAAACAARNQAAFETLARLVTVPDPAPALAAMAQLAPCPEPALRPWLLMLGGAMGVLVTLLAGLVLGSVARLEGALAEVPEPGPAAPPASTLVVEAASPPARPAVTAEAPAAAAPAPPEATPDISPEISPLPEDHPMVAQVVEEMRAQGLNITPEMARHVGALRVGRPAGQGM